MVHILSSAGCPSGARDAATRLTQHSLPPAFPRRPLCLRGILLHKQSRLALLHLQCEHVSVTCSPAHLLCSARHGSDPPEAGLSVCIPLNTQQQCFLLSCIYSTSWQHLELKRNSKTFPWTFHQLSAPLLTLLNAADKHNAHLNLQKYLIFLNNSVQCSSPVTCSISFCDYIYYI